MQSSESLAIIPPPAHHRSRQHRIVLALIAMLLLPAPSAQSGTIVSGPVSGTWGLAGSPYWVEGPLTVTNGQTLVIDSGVEVRFRGPFALSVDGSLQAAGTVTDSILFTWDQPLPAHEWRGIRLVSADEPTLLEYCTIEHVRASTTYPDVRGGAIYCESCSPAIRHCLLQYNVSHNGNYNGMGGGVAAVSASPTVEFCIMQLNEADSGGGFASIEEGTALVRNNIIRDNTAHYAGGGIYAGVRSSPTIENNLITDNTAHGWGGGGVNLWNWYAMFPVSKTVRNNVVVRNTTSTAGGGFYIRYDFSLLDNNTVADNTAGQVGGGAYVLNQGPGDYPPHLHDWILWGNSAATGPSIHPDPSTGSVVTVTYSDVEGGWSGTGNRNDDPLFVDAFYHLDAGSECVDAGDPGPAYNDECFPPSLGSERNDMGAYGGPLGCAWKPGTAAIDPEPAIAGGTAPPAASLRLGAAPNPFGVATQANYTLPAAGPVRLAVHDATGRLVRRLLDDVSQGAGFQSVEWDGRDASGMRVASGVYWLRLETGGRSATLRIVAVR